MRAASDKRRSARAESNQQDLIDEMKADRRHKTAVASKLMTEAGLAHGRSVIDRRCEACRGRQHEDATDCAARRSKRAFTSSTALRLMTIMMAFAPKPQSIGRGFAASVRLRFATRMARAAAHHQVEYQNCTAQYARQSSHTRPCSLYIPYRPQCLAIFTRMNPLSSRKSRLSAKSNARR